MFENKVVLITGAGSGIGRAAARLFAHHGARVALSDIGLPSVEETAAMIADEGGDAIAIACDVADRAAVEAMVTRTVDHYGGLHSAFNNAGITHPKDHEWDDEAFQRTLDVNVSGIRHCIKAEVPHMLKAGGGTIVNTASITAIVTSMNPSLPGYCASKHAVVGLTKVAALTYARQGIRVNAVLPGVTMTKMVADVMELGPEVKAMMENSTPMGRLAQPEEIAEAAIWLASDKSSFVTGHSLVADGGFIVQ
jgi:NAD(P)-dependent dehydrogenase (short-subunit alcohol dehydrogenase family)